MQEEQCFRETLLSERNKYDKNISKLMIKIEEREELLVEWVKMIAERNGFFHHYHQHQHQQVSQQQQPLPPHISLSVTSQQTTSIEDLKNSFSLLCARSVLLAPLARDYIQSETLLETIQQRKKKLLKKQQRQRGLSKKKKKKSQQE
jgi:hypothetical protein